LGTRQDWKMIKQYSTLILFLILTWQNCVGQTASVDSLFKEFRSDIIEQENDEQVLNRIYLDDKSKLRYYSFLQAASIDDLITHMNDSSAAMRCLIFSGLVGKGANREILVDIANEHKSDSADVSHISSDVANGNTVSDHIQAVLKWSIDYPQSKIDYASRIEKIKARRVVVIDGANYYDEIKIDALSELDSIYCTEKLMNIISFELYVRGKVYKSESNHLTTEMKNALQQVNRNDKLSFDDIRVLIAADSTNAGEVRKVANIALEIK